LTVLEDFLEDFLAGRCVVSLPRRYFLDSHHRPPVLVEDGLLKRFEGNYTLSRPGRPGQHAGDLKRRRRAQGSSGAPSKPPVKGPWQQPRRRQWKQGGWCGKRRRRRSFSENRENSASWGPACRLEAQRSQLGKQLLAGAGARLRQLDSLTQSSRPCGAHSPRRGTLP